MHVNGICQRCTISMIACLSNSMSQSDGTFYHTISMIVCLNSMPKMYHDSMPWCQRFHWGICPLCFVIFRSWRNKESPSRDEEPRRPCWYVDWSCYEEQLSNRNLLQTQPLASHRLGITSLESVVLSPGKQVISPAFSWFFCGNMITLLIRACFLLIANSR